MKTTILIILMFLAHNVWAQRAVYTSDGNKTAQPVNTIKLTEKVSIEMFVQYLKLDSVQEQRVLRILAKQKLHPVKGKETAAGEAMSYERRRALFEKEMKAILSERQYVQFMSMQ